MLRQRVVESTLEDIPSVIPGYTRTLTKRLIDVDDAKVAKAKELLGASSLKATIDGALDELIALDERRRSLIGLRGQSAELSNDDTRRAAWG